MTKKTATTNTTVGALKAALKRVTTATGAKSALLAVDEKGLRVEAATGEGYASVSVSIDGTAGCACQAQIGASLVNVILAGEDADTKLTVAADDKGARLRYAGANLLLKKPEASIEDLFAQTYKAMENVKIITLKGSDLKKVARGGVHYMATRDVRYYLCGVHLVARNGKLVVEGTDGFSIHQYNSDLELSPDAENLDVIIPVNAAQAMISIFADDEAVEMEKVGNQLIGFRTADAYWVSNMVAGKYPDCKNFFLPEIAVRETGVMMVLPRKSFVAALNRVSSVSLREGNFMRLVFEKKGIKVTSTDGEQEDAMLAVMSAGADGTFECHVTSAVVINTFDGIPGDHFLISKGPDPMDKLFVRPAVEVDGVWQFDTQWNGLMLPARF